MYRVFSNHRSCIVSFVAGVTAVLLAATPVFADYCSPTPQSGCGTPPCEDGPLFAGGALTQLSSPWPQYVAAAINVTAFQPIFSFSSVWSALEQRNYSPCGDCIAQVGYEASNALTNSVYKVFYQYTDNSGNVYPIEYTEDVTTGQDCGFDVQRLRDSQGNGSGFDFLWNCSYPDHFQTDKPATWGSDSIEVSGEAGDCVWYPICSTAANGGTGSHVVGNRSVNVSIRDVNWIDEHDGRHTGGLNEW
ncbi:MAG: hypothetical protein M3Z66_08605 [Chloroflexota bacterium]|nr:hypothetical protein [Chloroflexota bacterium]